jgi:predicted DNA-binding transcriptional regulator AlpA
MKEFDFTLKFSISEGSENPEDYLLALEQEGCTDALVGVGQAGRIALHFTREAETATEAVVSAIRDVEKAIPTAKLIEATPDLVGLSDIAQVLSFSRQYMRKLMLNHQSSFPAPSHEGKTALWHLSNVLAWLKQEGKYAVDESLLDVANTNMQLNFAKELSKLAQETHAGVLSLQQKNLASLSR